MSFTSGGLWGEERLGVGAFYFGNAVYSATFSAYPHLNFVGNNVLLTVSATSDEGISATRFRHWPTGGGVYSWQTTSAFNWPYTAAGVFTPKVSVYWYAGNTSFGSQFYSNGLVTINPLPNIVLDGVPTKNEPITFSDSSVYYDGTITSAVWNFGDGNTSSTYDTTVTFVHTFTATGNFNVTVSAFDVSGNVGVSTKVVAILENSNCNKKQDIITLCGPEMNGRYGSCKNIDLVNYLPLYLRETDTERFLQFFEDFLNEMFDGMCGFQTSSDNLPINSNYITSGVNAGDRNFTYNMDGNTNTDANIADKVVISWPSNATDIDPKISILEKVNRLTELHDPDLIDIDYIQFFAKNLGYNISINGSEIGSENFGFDSGIDTPCSASDINKYLRFMVSNLPHWYKIKTTRNSIKVMLYSFGLIGDIIDFYTKDYSEINEGNWKLDYSDDLEGIENSWYPSPHFGIVINLDESADISFDIRKRDKLIKAIESIRSVNTVFRRLVGYFQRTMNIWVGSVCRFTRYIKIESNGYSNYWS